MEGILVLGLLVILSLVIVALSSLASLKANLERIEKQLAAQLEALREEPRSGVQPKPEKKGALAPQPAAPTAPAPAPTVSAAPPVPVPEAPPLPVPPEIKAAEGLGRPPVAPPPAAAPRPTPSPVRGAAVGAERQETAVERLWTKIWNWIVVGEEYRRSGVPAEFAIAVAWLVRSGVIIVVMAVGFGLQLSIKKGLLGPSGRVALALLVGSAFVALGLRSMTKRLPLLGQGFIGGGLAMYYFAFFAAAMMYGLMRLSVAYGCMMVVTASAVLLAVRFNALSIAVLGAIGGYLTPVMLHTSRGDLPGLSAYLLLLAAGMLGVALWRRWPLLTWLSFFLNAVLFSVALGKYGTGGYMETAFASLFFMLFSTAMFVYPAFRKIKVTTLEIAPLFVNAMVTLAWGWLIKEAGAHSRIFVACLALGMAAFYVAHIWAFLFLRNFDRALLSAFIALTVILIGLALPLLFTGKVLSAMLALQALAFLWLGGRLESRMFVRGALGLYLIVLVRLFLGLVVEGDAFAVSDRVAYLQGLKDRLAEFVIPILSLFLASRCFRQLPSACRHTVGDAGMRASNAFGREFVAAVTTFYAAFIVYVTLEVYTASGVYMRTFAHASVSAVWCFMLFHLMSMRRHLSETARDFLTVMAGVFLLVQWLGWGWTAGQGVDLGKLCQQGGFSLKTALPRLLSTAACMAAMLKIRSASKQGAGLRSLALSVVLAMGLLYLTFEAATCCTVYVPGFRRGAVSVVWGCYGLSLLVGGLQVARKELRMVGLGLFALTLLKIFLIDLENSDVLFRLIAFGLVGLALLLAAYAYLKKQNAFTESAVDAKAGEA